MKQPTNTALKMRFSIKDLVTFTEEILNGELLFLCSVYDKNWSTELTFLFALNGSNSNSRNSEVNWHYHRIVGKVVAPGGIIPT